MNLSRGVDGVSEEDAQIIQSDRSCSQKVESGRKTNTAELFNHKIETNPSEGSDTQVSTPEGTYHTNDKPVGTQSPPAENICSRLCMGPGHPTTFLQRPVEKNPNARFTKAEHTTSPVMTKLPSVAARSYGTMNKTMGTDGAVDEHEVNKSKTEGSSNGKEGPSEEKPESPRGCVPEKGQCAMS